MQDVPGKVVPITLCSLYLPAEQGDADRVLRVTYGTWSEMINTYSLRMNTSVDDILPFNEKSCRNQDRSEFLNFLSWNHQNRTDFLSHASEQWAFPFKGHISQQ